MTTVLPTPLEAPEAPEVEASEVAPTPDPHDSKIAPDDPRLRLRPARARTLKKGPAIALVVATAATVIVCLVVALLPPSKAASDAKKAETEPPPAPPPPVIPEAIRNAPDLSLSSARPHPPPATDRLLVMPLPDGGIPRGDGTEAFDSEERPTQRRTQGGGRIDPRAEQELRARGSSILFEAHGPATASPATTSHEPALAPSLTPRGERPPSSSAADSDPNLQERKNSFLDSEGATKTTDYLQTSLQHPRSPYEIKAGTILPAVLITAINSDLPGPVIGQVRENVFDTVSGNYLLVPQGSRLLAEYDSMVAWGQERVLVCWNRLIFPNGDSIHLACMPAADLSGAAGLTDEVDEHWARIIKGAAVASLLAATTQAVAGNTEGYSPTVPQQWARGGASEINQAGQQITRRNLNIQPTITVRPGFSVNVIVTKDLVLPKPYPSDALDSPARTKGPHP